MDEDADRVALILVGAGLSGAATLAHLLRDHPDFCRRIAVVEPHAVWGAGLAYGPRDPAHRINVAANRMSLFPDRPDDFLDWIGRNGAVADDPEALGADGLLHTRRASFGTYVDQTVRGLVAASPAEVLWLRERAVAAWRAGSGWHVRLARGRVLSAPAMVLAIGHSQPDLPAALRGLAGSPLLVADPWAEDALDGIAADAHVLVVGTGLTACDVVASLRRRGHRGQILMLSRRGLLPRPRTLLPVAEFGRFDDRPATTARALLHAVRRAVDEAASLGRPWEDVIAALRVQAGIVWGALPVAERRRLLRHARPFWDVHRFQCAPQIDAVLQDGLSEGWLAVRAASLLGASAGPHGASVRLRPRGGPEQGLVFDRVVTCTGPGHRSVVESHMLLASLAARGALRADPCRLGIDVDRESRVLRDDGLAWPDLFVAGPLARGTHGELMGLPQVTLQPRGVAATVAALLGDGQARAATASVPP